MKNNEMQTRYEGKNAVLEAYKSGMTIDKLFVLDGISDSAISRILSEAKKNGTIINFVKKDRLDAMSETKAHQGIIAQGAAVSYSSIDAMFEKAGEKGEDPFFIILDGIEDPHNLGAIIRSANTSGAHGVIIPKHRNATLTATVAKASAGAISHTLIAKVPNIAKTLEELKKKGLWIAGADMDGKVMYEVDLKGPLGIVIGNEGKGISPLVKEKCDFLASIPIRGEIESLNASVACGILAYEVVRQRSI